jgi:uncharacterized membrane protein
MNEYKKRWQLKNKAKDLLTGHYAETALLTFLYGLFLIADLLINSVIMCYMPGESDNLLRILLMEITPGGYLIASGLSLLTSILFGILGVGIAFVYLSIACRQPYSMKHLFLGFRENPVNYLLLAIVTTLIRFFFQLPAMACNYFYLLDTNNQWMLLYYICNLAGQLAMLPLTLGLAQSVRLLLDYPDLSARKAIIGSFRLMKGHKTRYFLLTLSFLPLELAAAFTFGIGYLWLAPYQNMTYTLFYLDLMENQPS